MVTLRAYQESAIRELRSRIAAGRRRILVVAPTGGGKTCVFARVVADAVADARSVLVVAHRRELIQQTYDKLLGAGLDERQVGVVMASDLRRRPTAPVQVASIDTLRHRPKPPADLVIVDEAHRELARSYREMRAHYPDAVHLGFTATPYRADNRGLGEFYEDLLLVASIRELIDQGYLVEPRVFTVPAERLPNLAGVRVRAGDYAQDQLDEAVDQATLVGDIVEHWTKHASGVRTVAFAVSVKHSRHIAERFRDAGIAAEHLDGTTPLVERDGILGRLERGDTRVVSNVGVCSEGWDCLDGETQILTPTGWKGPNEVSRGQLVYALNAGSGLLEPTPAIEVAERPVGDDERMFRLKSQHLDIRTTAGHRFHLKSKAAPEAPFEVLTGEELSSRQRRYALPLAGMLAQAPPGLPLTDDELRFVAWFMTDGGFQQNRCQVGITQAKHFHNEIRELLGRLALDYTERVRAVPTGTYACRLPRHTFFVPKGTRSGDFARSGWFERFGAYLHKDVSPLLQLMTREQFLVFWKELLKGDGEQPEKSGWLWCDRRLQVDAYMQMAAVRGFATSYSERVTKAGRTVYRVSVRDRSWITSDPRDPRSARMSLEAPTAGERVWCVTTRYGTLVTRRGGKVVILGNCPPVKCAILARPTKSTGLYLQQAGRILRPWNEQRAIILDHAGCAREHGLPQDEREFSLEPKPKRKRGEPTQVPIRVCDGCQAVLPARLRVCPECGLLFVEERAVPTEVDGQLVEATAREPAAPSDDSTKKHRPRGDWGRAMQRTVFEQLRALARSRKENAAWVEARFIERYGAPPPPEWTESAWGTL